MLYDIYMQINTWEKRRDTALKLKENIKLESFICSKLYKLNILESQNCQSLINPRVPFS